MFSVVSVCPRSWVSHHTGFPPQHVFGPHCTVPPRPLPGRVQTCSVWPSPHCIGTPLPPHTHTHSHTFKLVRSSYGRQAGVWHPTGMHSCFILTPLRHLYWRHLNKPQKYLKRSPEVQNWRIKGPIMLENTDNTFFIFFLFFIKAEPNDLFIILPLHGSYLIFPFFLPFSFYYRNTWSQLLPI